MKSPDKLLAVTNQVDNLALSDSTDHVSDISLNVAQRCNFRCTYCYADQGTYSNKSSMALETARDSIDWLINHSGKSRQLGVTFFGGEPLMEFPLIKKVVAYTKQKELEHSLKFTYSITTNGSLLTDKVIYFLKCHNISVNVSLDGPIDLQNSQRPLINGKGSADIVFPKVKKLLDTHLRVSCRATIVSEVNRHRVRNFLEDFGFRNITITLASRSLSRQELQQPAQRSTDIDEAIWEIDNKELDNYLLFVKRRQTAALESLRISPYLYRGIFALLTKRKKRSFCGAGRNYAGISSTGHVYLCHRFVGQEGFCLGHVNYERNLKSLELLKNEFRTTQTTSKCRTCFAQSICGGGCYHNNFGTTGSPFVQSEEECSRIRSALESACRFVASLDEEDKNYLLAHNIIATKFCPLDL